jgi:hypothetical protein
MSYDYRNKKTVIVLSSNLQNGVAGNVIGHLALAIGYNLPADDMGRNTIADATGIPHRGISKYPVIITKVKPGRLRKFVSEAREQTSLVLIDYPEEMLNTGHDDELAAALAEKHESSINYLGAAVHGERSVVDMLAGRFTLWGPSTNDVSD